MTYLKIGAYIAILCSLTIGLPLNDVQIVESTIQEVKAAAPEDLLLAETSYGHDYGSDDEDSVGYLKRAEDGGSDGYSHFDSYHVKDGDKYGYEKHTAFGKADHANYDAGAESDNEGDDKGSYQVSEDVKENENIEHDDDESVDDDVEVDDSAAYTGESEHLEYDEEGDEEADVDEDDSY